MFKGCYWLLSTIHTFLLGYWARTLKFIITFSSDFELLPPQFQRPDYGPENIIDQVVVEVGTTSGWNLSHYDFRVAVVFVIMICDGKR